MRSLATLQFVGEELCLDLTNTINSRRAPEHDYLRTYDDLVEWAERAGAVTKRQSGALRRLAESQVDQAGDVLRRVIELRESTYRAYSALAAGSQPDGGDVELISAAYAQAMAHARLRRRGGRFVATWPVVGEIEAPLWLVAESTGRLLTSDDVARVKECPGCGWLFIDRSRNRMRRWCSMDTCGARDKMRRYYRRTKSQPGSPDG